MVRAAWNSLLVLVSLTLTSVALAQSNGGSPATETALDSPADMVRPSEVGGPHWTATADALLLQRSAADSVPLLYDPVTTQELVSASDLDFSMRAGERLSLRRENPGGLGLELTYAGIDSWRSSARIPDTALAYGLAYLPIDGNLAPPVNDAEFQYRSHLYNGEVNLRRALNDRLTPFVGFRYVDFEDRYAISGTDAHYSAPYAERVEAHNHLYGSQIGLDARIFDRHGPLRIDAVAEAGLYGNAASQNNNYTDTGSDFSASTHTGRLAFLGEVGMTGSLQLTHHLAMRGGYQLMWLSGVALAPDQISATDFGANQARVDASGSLFCHGANVGLEFAW